MTASTNPAVDFYFLKSANWQKELEMLRKIILATGLEEVLKWGCPCYTLGKKNVVLIHTFKEYCAILFFKGALMADENSILIQQTENVQLARQVRFTNTAEIKEIERVLTSYIYEAIAIEQAGVKPALKEKTAVQLPEEFQKQLKKRPELKKAFDALTPGRQRAYQLYFSQPKQTQTRESRIEKSIPQILAGKGIND